MPMPSSSSEQSGSQSFSLCRVRRRDPMQATGATATASFADLFVSWLAGSLAEVQDDQKCESNVDFSQLNFTHTHIHTLL